MAQVRPGVRARAAGAGGAFRARRRRARSRSASATATTSSSSPPRTRNATSSGSRCTARASAGVLLALEARQLTNVRIICHDAVEVLERADPAGTRGRDPGAVSGSVAQETPPQAPADPDAVRHAGRQPPGAGGVLRLATDWQPYALEMLETLGAMPGLENLASDGRFVPRPAERERTRFERRGERLGHEVWDLAFRRT